MMRWVLAIGAGVATFGLATKLAAGSPAEGGLFPIGSITTRAGAIGAGAGIVAGYLAWRMVK